jgi:disulfide bond formation protein DsbB
MASFANLFFSVLTVIAQAAILFVLSGFLFKKRIFADFFERNSLLFAFIIAFIATAGSLFYSEVLGYEPCELCWFQRIFMYPQVLLLGWALVKKEKHIGAYSILLSIFGAVIAGYNYLLQIGAASSVSCDIAGYSVDCSEYFAMNFGYITLPLMSFTAFILIITLLANSFKRA